MKDIGDAISSALTKGNENLIKQLQGKHSKLVKPAKVPSWTKGMKLEAYLKALEVWTEMNKDVSEAVRFQDVIESLKINKEIEGLAQYVGEHVIPKLDTIEKHTVREIVKLLKLKYGRTRIEELEELMEDWIKFNFNEHESEEDLRKRFNDLRRKEDWDKECEQCKNPILLHKTNCTRKLEVGEAKFSELWKIWSAFKAKMEPIWK